MSTAQSSSLLSSINAALHKLPLAPPGNIFAGSGKRGMPGIQNFEANLAERIASLRPTSEANFLSLSWLCAAMSVVLGSHSAVESLIPDLRQSPLTRKDEKWVSEFLDESAKLLDVCNGLRESVGRLEECQMLVQLVLQNLNIGCASFFSEGQLQRAKKAVLDCQVLIERPGDDDQDLSWPERAEPGRSGRLFSHRSWPERAADSGSSGRLFSLDRRRSNSWGSSKEKGALQRLQSRVGGNGSAGGATTTKEADSSQVQEDCFALVKTAKKATDLIPEIELLKGMTDKFVSPKGVDAARGRNAFIAGIHAAKVTTVCILGVVYVTLKSNAGTDGLTLLMTCSSQISRPVTWAPPLLDLLEGVAAEIRLQRKETKLTSFLSELVSIDTSMGRLLDLIQTAEARRSSSSMPPTQEEELRQELAALRQHFEDLEQGLGHLEEQVNELFRMLIASRTQLLDLLGNSKGLS